MRWAAIVILAACTTESDPAFSMLGVVDPQPETGSTIGLWALRPEGGTATTFKFGDGDATPTEFGISFRIDPPPPGAINTDGIGVANVGMLPGRATVNEGAVDPSAIFLIGMTTDSAVIFKSAFSTGPAWTAQFPEGYSCGVCVRDPAGPDSFEPADCTFVTIHRVFNDPCDF